MHELTEQTLVPPGCPKPTPGQGLDFRNPCPKSFYTYRFHSDSLNNEEAVCNDSPRRTRALLPTTHATGCLLRSRPDHAGQVPVVRGSLWVRQSLLERTQHPHNALRHGLRDQALHPPPAPPADYPRITPLHYPT